MQNSAAQRSGGSLDYLVEVEDEVQLTDIAKVAVQNLHIVVNDLQRDQLVVAHGQCPSQSTSWRTSCRPPATTHCFWLPDKACASAVRSSSRAALPLWRLHC